MTRGVRWLAPALAPALAVAAHTLGATTAAAQRTRELGLQVTGLASDPAVGVAGLYGALRLSARTRVAATAGLGREGDRTVGRGELLAHFLLSPTARRGLGLYGGGGIAANVTSGKTAEFVVLTLGLESKPGARSGWAIEAGVGGGARVTIGYRWRWHRAPDAK